MENKMSFMVECEDCKHKFQISNNINHKKEFKVNGKSIFLTYYDCPSCGRRHCVQIDDATSIAKLKDVTNQFFKLSILKKRGEEIPKKQLAKFNKARQILSDYRMNLMKEYTGKLVHNDDMAFVLRFLFI